MKKNKNQRFTFLYKLALQLPKRLRFVIASCAMTGMLLLTTFFEFDKVWIFLPMLAFLAYFFVYFSIIEGLHKAEWIVLFIMPVFFTVFVYCFYFLFPVRWLTRVPLILTYGFSFYALLLTTNIFNVGVEKNIQLYRAAFSVNFLFQTLVIFLIMQVLQSFQLPFYLNVLATFALIFPIAIQLLWSVKPQIELKREVIFYASLITLLLAELALFVSFLPLRSTIISLLITASYYSIGGLMYHYMDEKLFKQTIREYSFVMIFVVGIVLLTIQW